MSAPVYYKGINLAAFSSDILNNPSQLASLEAILDIASQSAAFVQDINAFASQSGKIIWNPSGGGSTSPTRDVINLPLSWIVGQPNSNFTALQDVEAIAHELGHAEGGNPNALYDDGLSGEPGTGDATTPAQAAANELLGEGVAVYTEFVVATQLINAGYTKATLWSYDNPDPHATNQQQQFYDELNAIYMADAGYPNLQITDIVQAAANGFEGIPNSVDPALNYEQYYEDSYIIASVPGLSSVLTTTNLRLLTPTMISWYGNSDGGFSATGQVPLSSAPGIIVDFSEKSSEEGLPANYFVINYTPAIGGIPLDVSTANADGVDINPGLLGDIINNFASISVINQAVENGQLQSNGAGGVTLDFTDGSTATAIKFLSSDTTNGDQTPSDIADITFSFANSQSTSGDTIGIDSILNYNSGGTTDFEFLSIDGVSIESWLATELAEDYVTPQEIADGNVTVGKNPNGGFTLDVNNTGEIPESIILGPPGADDTIDYANLVITNPFTDGSVDTTFGTLTSTGTTWQASTTSDPLVTEPDLAGAADTLLSQIFDEIIAQEFAGDLPATWVVQAITAQLFQQIVHTFPDLSFDGTAFADGVFTSFSGSVGSYFGGELGAALANDLGINPNIGSLLGGEFGSYAFQALADEISGQAIPSITFSLLSSSGLGEQAAQDAAQAGLSADATQTAVGEAEGAFDPLDQIGSFLGEELANAIVTGKPEGASIGSVLLGAVGEYFFGPIGAFIGAFIGDLIGGLFGPGRPNPTSWATISLNDNDQFVITANGTEHGAPAQIGLSMGQSAAAAVNAVLAQIGGQVANVLSLPGFSFGLNGYVNSTSTQVAYEGGNESTHFASAEAALDQGVIAMLKQIQIDGGDPFMKCALANSDATTLAELSADLQVAKVYEEYFEDPQLFEEGMKGLNNTTAERTWSSILVRAKALGLTTLTSDTNEYSRTAEIAAYWAAHPDQAPLAATAGSNTITASGNTNIFAAGNGVDVLISTAGFADILEGDAENDTLTASGMADTLIAGSGLSTLTATGQGNTLEAGSGTDVLVAIGQGDSLVGGAGAADMTAFGESEFLKAGAGVDILKADGEDNVLQGGVGDDTLIANGNENNLASEDAADGTNTLIARGMDNVLQGGAGTDVLTVVGDRNYLTGSTGAVTMIATGDANILSAGKGDATFSVTGNNNIVIGGGGTNSFTVDGNDNTLNGSTGNDIFHVTGTDNLLTGGGGDDTFIGGNNDTYDFGTAACSDTIDPGTGGTIEFGTSITASDVKITTVDDDLILTIVDRDITIDLADDLTLGANGSPVSAIQTVLFADGKTLNLNALGSNSLDGSAGDLTLTGSNVQDNQFILGVDDTLIGGALQNTYDFGDAARFIPDTPDAPATGIVDTIEPGGNDTLAIELGDINSADIQLEASGDNLIIDIVPLNESVEIVGGLSRNAEGQVVSALNAISFADGSSMSLSGTLNFVEDGTAGNETLTATGWGTNLFKAGADDALIGSAQTGSAYLLDLGDSGTTILPGAQDTIEIAADLTTSEVTLEQSGNDLLLILDGVDTIDVSNDLATTNGLTTTKIQEIKFLGDGTIWTTGQILTDLGDFGASPTPNGLGTPTIFVAAEGETLTGGTGDNIFDYSQGTGNVTINPGTSNVIQFAGGITRDELTFQIEGANLVITIDDDASGDQITLHNYATGITQFNFSDGTSWNLTGSFASTWDGSDGNATLTGTTSGPNIFVGGTGDTLIGATGVTNIYDVDDVDEVINPEAGDVIRLGTGITEDDVTLTASGSNLLLEFANGATLTVANDLSASGSLVNRIEFADGVVWNLADGATFTWNGKSGSEALSGSNFGSNVFELGASDTVVGGSGANNYVFDGSVGSTTITTGSDDTLLFGGTLTARDIVCEAVGTDLIITIAGGGTINLLNDLSGSGQSTVSAVKYILFADGSELNLSKALTFDWTTTGKGKLVIGSGDGANVFEVSTNETIVATGDENTFMVGGGIGDVTITPGLGGAIDFSSTIVPSDILLEQSGNDLIIKIGDGTDILDIANDLANGGSAMTVLNFADGVSDYIANLIAQEQGAVPTYTGSVAGSGSTAIAGSINATLTGSNGANTYTFDDGVGLSTINPGTDDTVEFGGALTAGDVTYSVIGNDLIVYFDDFETLTLNNDLSISNGTTISAVKELLFDDGTSLNLSAPLTFQWLASSISNQTVTGSNYGANVFQLSTNETIIGGDGENTYDAWYGIGAVSITPGSDDALSLAYGITAADISIVIQGGDLVVDFYQEGGLVGFEDDIVNGQSRLKVIQFADGSVEYVQAIVDAELGVSDTLNGSQGGVVLTGSNSESNVFDVAAGDTVTGGQDGVANLYQMGANFNGAVIAPAGSNDTIEMSAALTAANVQFSVSGDNLLIIVPLDGETLTLENDIVNGSQSILSDIQFADGSSINLSTMALGTINDGTAGGEDLVASGLGENTFELGANDTVVGGQPDGKPGSGINIYDFNVGDGGSVITPGSNDTIEMGNNIQESDVILETVGGNLLVIDTASGDTLTVDGDFYSSWGRQTDVAAIQFADGTKWSLANQSTDLAFTWGDAIGTEQSAPTGQTLVGSAWGQNIFYLAADDTVIGGQSGGGAGTGQNTYFFDKGDGGSVVVTAGNNDTIELASDVLTSDVVLEASGNNLILKILSTGDTLTIDGDFYNSWGRQTDVKEIVFADGTTWSLSNQSSLLDYTWQGQAGNETLTGAQWSNNIFYLGADDTVIGGQNDGDAGSGQNTYMFGYGDGGSVVTTAGNNDTIELGAGISESDVVVEASGGNLIVKILNTGDTLTVDGDFYNSWGRQTDVDEITFADGTTWTLNNQSSLLGFTWEGQAGNETLTGSTWSNNIFYLGADDTVIGGQGSGNTGSGENTYVFGYGDGGSVVTTAGNNDSVQLAPNISASDVVLEASGGNLIVKILSTGDTLTIDGDFYNSWGRQTDVERITFADGTTWTLNNQSSLLGFTWEGQAGDETLTGSTWSNNIFYLGADDTVIGGQNDGDAGSGQNTYMFGYGDGGSVVTTAGNNDTIELGAGISESDVVVEASGGNLIVKILNTGDTLTVDGDFYNSWGRQTDVEEITFADGTTWTLNNQSSLLGFTWEGQAGNETLVGSYWSNNIFYLGADDTVVGGQNNGDMGSGENTYVFGEGDGGSVVTTPGNNDTVQLAADISESDVVLEASGSNLIVEILGTDDTLTIDGDFYNSWGRQTNLAEITFADGTTWTLNNQSSLLNFTWEGQAGNETLVGSYWSNNIFYLGADDTVIGGQGSGNTGSGENTYVFGYGDGGSVVTTPGNNDTVELAPNVSVSDVSLAVSGNNLIIELLSTGETLTIDGDFYNNGNASSVTDIDFAGGGAVNPVTPDTITWSGASSGGTLTGADSYADNIFIAGSGDVTMVGATGFNEYEVGAANVQDVINNSASVGSGPTGEIAFTGSLDADDLWFAQSGNNLTIDVLDSTEQVTVQNWFESTSSQVSSFISADNLILNNASVEQLIAAMATFEADNPGFNPETATSMPTDATLQAALTAAWHH